MRKFLVFVKDKKLEPNGVRADYLFGDINDAFVIYREKRLKTYLRFIYHLIKFDHTVYLMGFDTIVVLILFFLNYKDFFYDTGDFEYALSRSFRNRFLSLLFFNVATARSVIRCACSAVTTRPRRTCPVAISESIK